MQAGRRDCRRAALLGGAGEQVAEPAARLDRFERQSVVVEAEDGGAQEVPHAHRAAAPRAERLEPGGQLVAVHLDPAAAELHQVALGDGERLELRLGERLAAERGAPLVVDQVAEAEAGAAGDSARLLRLLLRL